MNGSNFKIGDIEISQNGPLFVMAGPCVIEDAALCLDIAERLKKISQDIGVSIIYKSSFDKANRTSITSYRGPGLSKGLAILYDVKCRTGLPIMTDIHTEAQVEDVAAVVDCLQIPAFLCRQTDLLAAAARTQRPINIKKGQFLSPYDMVHVVNKIRHFGNEQIILTERGTCFGYNYLINDMTTIPIMKGLNCPVVFDATHGTPIVSDVLLRSRMTSALAKAAVAAGANGLFIETHIDPMEAKCDSATTFRLSHLMDLLRVCKEIFEVVRR